MYDVLQSILLAKAIVVALLDDDNALPKQKADGTRSSGLVFLFLPIILGAIFSALQGHTSRAILAGQRLKS